MNITGVNDAPVAGDDSLAAPRTRPSRHRRRACSRQRHRRRRRHADRHGRRQPVGRHGRCSTRRHVTFTPDANLSATARPASTTRSSDGTAAPTPATVTVDRDLRQRRPGRGRRQRQRPTRTRRPTSPRPSSANDTDVDGDTLDGHRRRAAPPAARWCSTGRHRHLHADANDLNGTASFDYKLRRHGGTDTGHVTVTSPASTMRRSRPTTAPRHRGHGP